MAKGDIELKLFHSMVKYNDFFDDSFAAPGLSGILIDLMGG